MAWLPHMTESAIEAHLQLLEGFTMFVCCCQRIEIREAQVLERFSQFDSSGVHVVLRRIGLRQVLLRGLEPTRREQPARLRRRENIRQGADLDAPVNVAVAHPFREVLTQSCVVIESPPDPWAPFKLK